MGLGIFLLASCEDYLDRAPESGLSVDDVFSKYDNFMLYFDGIYNGKYIDLQRPNLTTRVTGDFNIKCAYPMFWSIGNQSSTWDMMTEIAESGRGSTPQAFKTGSYTNYNFIYTYAGFRPILRAMFMVIRRANMALEKIGMLKNASEQDILDIKGQAYFMRAYAAFMLHKTWGPMPYIRKVVGPDDQWDMERLPPYEHLINIAADFDTAAMYFKQAGLMRRDNPVPGAPGHLVNANMFRPTGCAAKALKARALLYAASPLNNSKGKTAWEEAAKANWEAIDLALQNGYALLTLANYKYNYVGAEYSNEQLWGYYAGTGGYNSEMRRWQLCGPMSQYKTFDGCVCPTQNAVDKYETKWGDPLNTEADRLAAAALGHFNEQDPYKNRDPRFDICIMYNTKPIPSYGTAKIYYEMVGGTPKYAELQDQSWPGITKTGYYLAKQWGGESTKNRLNMKTTDPLIRLGELYMNYAEAANEAYGPNTPAPGASLTAVQAVNLIRARVNHVPVQDKFTVSTEIFRPRIKNERFSELGFEGFHYFFDIRRWMDAPRCMTEGQYDMVIEKLAAGYDKTSYPTGYRYTRVLAGSNRQPVWKDAMYYFAFNLDDMQKMGKFIPNELW